MRAANARITVLPAPKGRLPASRMNKTEADYGLVLEARRQAGEVAWYRYECLRLILAPDTTYCPDFLVMLADGTLELHEVKGFMREDAHVKLKVVAASFPFPVKLVRRDKGGWEITEV